MILKGLAVLLLGAAVSGGLLVPNEKARAEIVIRRHSSDNKITEYYPSSGGSPLISNVFQKGSNFFFKPLFLLSAAQMPPQVQAVIAAIEKDDCKTSLPMGPIPTIIEEPVQVSQKEIFASTKPIIKEVTEIIPEKYNQYVQPNIELAPAAPPAVGVNVMELPKRPIMVEDSAELEIPYLTGEERVIIPEAPTLSPYIPPVEMPASAVIKSDESKNIGCESLIDEIPPAPVLPPLEFPTLPVLADTPAKEIVEAGIRPQDAPEFTLVKSNIPQTYIREVVISPPEAPVLPPLDMPKPIPVKENMVIKPLEIPAAPILPPFEMPEEVLYLPGNDIHEIKPAEIPVATILAPYVPKLPVVEEQPIVIPQAPELPPFSLPELPLRVVVEEKIAPSPNEPCEKLEVVKEIRSEIPKAPILASYNPVRPIIKEPASSVVENEISELINVPAPPVLTPFTLPELPLFVSKGQVSEKVVPYETVQTVEPLVIPEAPVLTPYIPVDVLKPIIVEEPVNISLENEITKPLAIPAPPVLPPFEVPKLPVVIEESKLISCLPNEEHVSPPLVSEVVVSPHSPVIVEEKLFAIPEAPVLPPLSFSELPMHVDEKVVPHDIIEVMEPLVIPEAPVLTSNAPIEISTSAFVKEPVTVKVQKSVEIPFAPVLPPLELSKSSVIIKDIDEADPCTDNELGYQKVDKESMPMVTPIPYGFSETFLTNTRESKPIFLTSVPEFLVAYFPTVTKKQIKEELACAHDIVVERILPHLGNSLNNQGADVPVSSYLAPITYAKV